MVFRVAIVVGNATMNHQIWGVFFPVVPSIFRQAHILIPILRWLNPHIIIISKLPRWSVPASDLLWLATFWTAARPAAETGLLHGAAKQIHVGNDEETFLGFLGRGKPTHNDRKCSGSRKKGLHEHCDISPWQFVTSPSHGWRRNVAETVKTGTAECCFENVLCSAGTFLSLSL